MTSQESDAAQAIHEHYASLLRAAIMLTGHRAEAEDLVQESFLRALDSWHRYQGKSSRKTWLYGILVNVHRNSLRGAGRRWYRVLRWFDGRRGQQVPLPSDELLSDEWKASLWRAVAKLPVTQQQVIALRFSEELTYVEIAEAVGCPVGTVKSRINTALKKLRDDHSINRLDASVARQF